MSKFKQVFDCSHIKAKMQTMESAPKDRFILVWHDHESDQYHFEDGHLTIYGSWCEGIGYEKTPGIYIAKFGGGYNDFDGYYEEHMPDWWFKHDDDNNEYPLAPTHWKELE